MHQFMHVQSGRNRVYNCNPIFKGLHVPKGSEPTLWMRARTMFLSRRHDMPTSIQSNRLCKRLGIAALGNNTRWKKICIIHMKFIATYIYMSTPKMTLIFFNLPARWFHSKVNDRAFLTSCLEYTTLTFRIYLDFLKVLVLKFYLQKKHISRHSSNL